MQVFLIRHAEADDTSTLAGPHRTLTPHGRKQARSLGDRLRWHDCAPTHLWTSPHIAAVQTAELLAGRLDHDVAVAVLAALEPAALGSSSQQAIATALVALPPEAIVYLVGHQASLSALMRSIAGKAVAAIQPAEAIRIVDGVIRWRFAWDDEAADTTPDLP